MKLSELLTERNILLDFQAKDKWASIDAMVGALIAEGRIQADIRKAVTDALIAREKIASTGIEHGIALPHAWIDGLPEAHAVFGLSTAGVPFQCSDGQPARHIVMLIIPRQAVQQHSHTLAGIARLLNFEEIRDSLIRARSAREVLQIIRDEESKENC